MESRMRWRHSTTQFFWAKPGLIAGLIFISGCFGTRGTAENYKVETIFFNSFEEGVDTSYWQWHSSYSLTTDTPPNGGDHALRLSRVERSPVATYVFDPTENPGYFTLQCWGKIDGMGGYIQLASVNGHEIEDAIQVPVMTPQWQQMQSHNILYCDAGSQLMITIHTSEFLRGNLLVDRIEIRRAAEIPERLAGRVRNKNQD